MEVAGLTISALAIATLFNTCVDCFETFSQGRNLQRDVSHLLIRLDFEKIQMLLWGKSSGILSIDSSGPHARLSDQDVCKLVEDALIAIQDLLSDASKLRQRYGVDPLTATPGSRQSTFATLLSSNDMQLFRYSWSKYCIRAAQRLPERGSSSTLAKARWAIHDRAKFTELLETLSILVEKLHRIIPVSDSRQELENNLAMIPDISQLSLIETSLQSSSHPTARALSQAASEIISGSENGTIDRRNILEWMQDAQWTDELDGPPPTSIERPARLDLKDKLSYLSVNTKKSLYFVNTPPCRNLNTPTPCPTISAPDRLAHPPNNSFHKNGSASLRLLFPNLARSKNFEPYEYSHMSARSHENAYAIARIRQMLPFGTIYIHTSPCQCALQTATDIAIALGSDQLRALVRVDDRISSTCLPSPTERIVILQALLAQLDALEPSPTAPWTALDRTWLDQRLYVLESDFDTTSHSNPSTSTPLLDVFSALEHDPGPFAGLIIVAETDVCIPLLNAEPFPWTPRFAREREVYEVMNAGGGFRVKYVSRFTERTNVEGKGTQRQAVSAENEKGRERGPGKRTASPLAKGGREESGE